MKLYLWIGLFLSVVLVLGLTLAERSFQASVAASIPSLLPAIDNRNLFADHTPLTVTITAAGRRAPWRTTIDEITSSPSMWRRMHLADWNVVPEPLRDEGLDRMLTHYARLLNNPTAWGPDVGCRLGRGPPADPNHCLPSHDGLLGGLL